jgi:hypothetical protein
MPADPHPRFTGYSAGAHPIPATSYWVQDLDYNRTVATYYSGYREPHEPTRRACAEADAARFNAWHEAWLAKEPG